MGGSGGGKPDMAQAGGSDPSKLAAAINKLYELLSQPRP
jgi:alanyl-tRNA synthetase